LLGVLGDDRLRHHGVVPSQLEGARLGRVCKVVLGRKVNGLFLRGGADGHGSHPLRARALGLKVIGHGQGQGGEVMVEAGYPMGQHRGLDHVDPLELLNLLQGSCNLAVWSYFWSSCISLEGQGRLSTLLFLLQQFVGQSGFRRIRSSTLKERRKIIKVNFL